MNNYCQLGIEDQSNKFLLTSVEDSLKEAMQTAKQKLVEELDNLLTEWEVSFEASTLMDFSQAKETTKSYVMERLNRKFDLIYSVDFVQCGWFHSIVVVNSNILLGAGHSYFDQLFGKPNSNTFQCLHSERMDLLKIDRQVIEKIDKGELIDLFNREKVTHLWCGTFSTTFVTNHVNVYTCGEHIKEATNFKKDFSVFNQNYFISKIFHLDTGISIETSRFFVN